MTLKASRIVKSRLKTQDSRKQWYENSDTGTSEQAVDLNSEVEVTKPEENSDISMSDQAVDIQISSENWNFKSDNCLYL